MVFTLNLFGPISLRGPDDADLTPKSNKPACILAFLALQPSGRATRERLCGMLWSNRGEEQARGSLRQALAELRRAWKDSAPGLLQAEHSSVGLDMARLSVDVLEAERLIESGGQSDGQTDWPKVAALWRGQLLAGMSARDQAFDEWLLIERAHRARRLESAIAAALEQAERQGADAAIEALAGALLRHDTTHERGFRALMELDLRRGDAAGALRRFATFRDILSRELDIKPSPECEALQAKARRLATVRPVDTVRPGAPARPERPRPAFVARAVRRLPRLAVQFRPPIGPPEMAGQLHGMVQEELLLCLNRARQLAVIVLPDGGVGRQDEDYRLTGAVACDGQAGRVTMRLCRQSDSQMIMGEQIALPASGAHAVAVLETGRIAFAVEYAIGLEGLAAGEGGGDGLAEPDAYALWQAGDRLGQSFHPEDLQTAIGFFEQAAKADPTFAKPIAGLAAIELSRTMISPTDIDQSGPIANGLRLAKQAVALDPWDAKARVILAWAHLRLRSPDAAQDQLRRALALNPHDPDVHIECAEALAYFRDPDGSLASATQAMRAHFNPPEYYYQYLSVAHTTAGDHERALAHNLTVSDSFPEQLAWRAVILARLGRDVAARGAVERLLNEIRSRWSGTKPFGKPELLAWLEQTLLIPDEVERADFVTLIRRLMAD